jgi:hypothetical protein
VLALRTLKRLVGEGLPKPDWITCPSITVVFSPQRAAMPRQAAVPTQAVLLMSSYVLIRTDYVIKLDNYGYVCTHLISTTAMGLIVLVLWNWTKLFTLFHATTTAIKWSLIR